MSDVAAAAGVARATVYRYFPSRQVLLDELALQAMSDAAARLASARLTEVAPEQAVTRAVRAFLEVGDPFVVLARERVRPQDYELRLAAPLRDLFERGRSSGSIRDDVPSSWLVESLVGLVVSVLASPPALGREDTVAAIASLFLDGARARRPRLA